MLSEQAPVWLFSSTNYGPGEIRGFCKKNICSVNAKCIKIKAFKFMNTGSWQNKNTILSTDTGIECDGEKDFAVVIGANSETDTKLLYTPCIKNGHWYVSSNCYTDGGAGPNGFFFVVLTVE